MRVFNVPQKIHNKIDRINRNFLWGHSTNNKKLHLINWDNISKPKNLGGLGIKKSNLVNAAFMAKLKWDLETNPNKPWVALFKLKYKDQDRIYKNSSFVYKSIGKDKKIFSKNLSYLVRNGMNINPWNDPWFDNIPLRH